MGENAVVTEQSDTTENAAAPPPPTEERQWFAVHTYSGYENKVKTHLEARVQSLGWRVAGVIPSPLSGRNGNREFFIGAARD